MMRVLLSLFACRKPDPLPPVQDDSATPTSPQPEPSIDWPHPNGDGASTRAALGAEICSDTVHRLSVVWWDDITTALGISTNPIVYDDIIYYQTMASDIKALDRQTGEALWRHLSGALSIGPTGVAVDSERLYAAIDPLTFAALDRFTGEILWTTDLRVMPTEGIDIQPFVWGHAGGQTVYVATVPMIPTAAHFPSAGGVLYALDAATGQIRWSFDTIDDRDTFWGAPDVNSGGGAWFPPTIEADGSALYWGIGNPGPFPGNLAYPNASSRPGPNLYTNSLVALHPDSGDLLWYDQVTPHDLFDFDFHLSPIRVDLQGSDGVQELLIGAGKAGRVIAWDPRTGERRWEAVVGRHENDTLTEVPLGQTITVFPGIYGAAETPMAYADGLLFIPVANLGSRYTATGKEFPEFDEILAATGELVALDAATGERVWSIALPSPLFSGATVSCDLVFTATFDGTVLAYERATGIERWRWEAGVGSNSWMAVSGDMLLIPMGVPLGDVQPGLVALRLSP